MTILLGEFRPDNPRLRRRPDRVSTGQVYYGEKLRRVLEEPPPSIVSRFDDHHWAVALALIAVAVAIAAWIAS